tara:strand:+ start:747 stop:1025 length:279 start_codon:yes stop_codon:yes gene_type:complete
MEGYDIMTVTYPLRDEAWEDELFDEIQKGDRVWYKNSVGQVCKGKAVMQGPAGWVIDIGGGQPQVVNEGYNYLGHSKAKGRTPDYLGKFLHG